MIGKCALYDIETELMQSHIIPKFAFDFLKKTGGKYLRAYEKPNQRIQDGPKKYLLSTKAELEFSKRERWFANNIFIPYMKLGVTKFEYKEDFAYFIISLLWRVLLVQLKHPNVIPDKRLDFLTDVESEWKNFLSKGVYPWLHNDLNVFLTDRISSHNTNGINNDLYFSRMIDATIITNEKGTKVAVYAKFLRFIFWSVVKGDPNDCKDTKINFIKGTLTTPQLVRDDFFGGFLRNRVEEIDNMPEPSEIQKIKIQEETFKKENDFWNTDAGKAMINDYELRSKASS